MKIIKLILLANLFLSAVFLGAAVDHANIDNVIAKSRILEQSVVSISIKDAETGELIYGKDDKKLLHPASTLKIFTLSSAMDLLGEDYEFATKVYKIGNSLYIKLGGDPLLRSSDLKILLNRVKKTCNNKILYKIFIDGSIIDSSICNGWMYDDVSIFEPPISSFALNKNKIAVVIHPEGEGGNIDVVQRNPYKIKIKNCLKKGKSTSILLLKDFLCPDTVVLNGVISENTTVEVPVCDPREHFFRNFEKILSDEGFNCLGDIELASVPIGAIEIAKISHSMRQVATVILHNSDNFAAETVFRVAGGKFINKSRHVLLSDSISMFNSFCKKFGINTAGVRVSDGCGISRYNLVSADWETDALVALCKNTAIKKYLCRPGLGTLANRFSDAGFNLCAKTGTLSGVAALCGFIEVADGHKYVFSIIVSNFIRNKKEVVRFIDSLVREMVQN